MENNALHDFFAHINVMHRLVKALYDRQNLTRAEMFALRQELMIEIQQQPQALPGDVVPSEVLLDVQRRAVHIMDNFLQSIERPPEDSRA